MLRETSLRKVFIKMERNIVFDLDGVILDSERLVLSIWDFLGGKYGINGMRETMLECIGTTHERTKEIIFEKYGDDFPYDEMRAEASAQFKERTKKDGVPVKAGARELIQYLHTNGWKIGLATSTRGEVARDELKFLGLLKFFDYIVTGDMITESKPHPEIYFKVCEQMGVKPEDVIAVEDSRTGVRAAAMAGLKVILVPDVLEPDAETERLAWKQFKDLLEVRNLFKG